MFNYCTCKCCGDRFIASANEEICPACEIDNEDKEEKKDDVIV